MTNIKVTYKSITRRLGISSTTAWSELESQFHTLFNIPQEIPITVSYTDEEGDDITLSSDLELQEALSNPSNKTIKFVLKTPDEKKKSHNVDTAMDEATSSLIHGVSAIHLQETDHQDHAHDQETRGETSKKAAETTNDPEENQDSSDEEEIIVIITRNHGRSRSEAQRFRGWNPYYTFGRRSRHASLSGCNPSSRSSRGCGNRRRHQISPEVMTEKLNLLHSMGFFNDNLEELVRRYNGNLEQVIEVLLLDRREEQSDERNKEKSVRYVREEDGKQSMEVMEVEENTAYDL